MSDEWDFYALLVDGEPASIFVDMGIAKSAPIAGYSRMGYLRVRMLRPLENGLSSQEEYDDLVALEDSVAETITDGGKAIYVGHNTSSGIRELYFYVRGTSFEQDATAAMASWPQYQFDCGSRPDEAWSSYWNFLYPSEADRQRMLNREVFKALKARGDDLQLPRQIDHFAYFKTDAVRNAFASFVWRKGFTVGPMSTSLRDTLSITFHRLDRPDDINDITVELDRTARQHGGDYDGWESPVTG